MKNVNKKIYATQDFCVNARNAAIIMGLLFVLVIFYTWSLIEWFDEVLLFFAIIHVITFFVWMLWYLIKVIKLLIKSDKYKFFFVENFAIEEDSIVNRGRHFSLIVKIDDKTYKSDKIITANLFAHAQENNALEIGLNNEDNTIIVVKPF